MSTAPQLIPINIDGRPISVPAGTNAIEAARLLNIDIPHYCYHPKLTIAGNCRQCLVETGTPALDPATKQPLLNPDGTPQIRWNPKPQIGCATNATPGLHIRTRTQTLLDARAAINEFLLLNHPLDCPICDQAGECRLQEQALAHGTGKSRYIEPKNTKPKRTQIGPRVILDDERCILCTRCIRFCNEVIKQPVLGLTERGSHSTLTCDPARPLDSNYSLNTTDICPVGALTSTDFRFKMRIWFLKQTPSICTESSTGVNTTIWSREGQIYRITPRRNDAVNQTWMPDTARLLYKTVTTETRLLETKVEIGEQKLEINSPTKSGEAADSGAKRPISNLPSPISTLSSAAALLRQAAAANTLAIIASPHATLEEQHLLQKLARQLAAPIHAPLHRGTPDNFLISDDHAPNTAGLRLLGITPADDLRQLAADIDAKQTATLLIHKENPLAHGLTPAHLAKTRIIYIGTHANETQQAAAITLPSLTVFEKTGTFINKTNRLQKFAAAIPPPNENVRNDLTHLQTLLDLTVGASLDDARDATPSRPDNSTDAETYWPQLQADHPQLPPTHAAIPNTGHQL